MAEGSGRGGLLMSGLLGRSSVNTGGNERLLTDVPEGEMKNSISQRGSFHSIDTPNELDIWGSSPPRNTSQQKVNQEKVKLHRRGSYIDWGAGAFDFSGASTGIEIFTDQNKMHYKPDAHRVPIISSDGGFQVDLLASSQKAKTKPTIDREFRNVTPNMAVIEEEGPLRPNTNVTNLNILARIDENSSDKPNFSENTYVSCNQDNVPHSPPKPSARSLQRRQSILDIVEDKKIEAAPQGAFFAGVSIGDPYMASDIEQQQQGHTMLGGILGSWFFVNNKNDGSNTLPMSSQSPIKGVGGGVLTSKVVSALKMNPDSKIEAGKMNSWMPASF